MVFTQDECFSTFGQSRWFRVVGILLKLYFSSPYFDSGHEYQEHNVDLYIILLLKSVRQMSGFLRKKDNHTCTLCFEAYFV